MKNSVHEKHAPGDALPWRYTELFKVSVAGEEPLLVTAVSALGAIDKAAEELGMALAEIKKLGVTVTTPAAGEIMRFARDKHRLVRMRVQHEGYPDYICDAYNRMDAKLQAANAWNVSYLDIDKTAKCGVSPHCVE